MSHMDPSLAAIAEDNCVDVVCLGKPQVVTPDVVDQIGHNIRALSFHEAAFAFLEIPKYRSDFRGIEVTGTACSHPGVDAAGTGETASAIARCSD